VGLYKVLVIVPSVVREQRPCSDCSINKKMFKMDVHEQVLYIGLIHDLLLLTQHSLLHVPSAAFLQPRLKILQSRFQLP
jgi:hypothetical protein